MPFNEAQSLENFSAAFHVSRDKTHAGETLIPGGFSRRTFAYGPHAVFVERGEGQYIHTVDGRKLLDLNNNFTTNVLGHRHPAILSAMKEVVDKGFSFGNPMDYELELGHLLIERIQSVEQIKFFCSASEACMGAVRIARGHTGKNKIAKFEGGYHGFGDDLAVSAHPGQDGSEGADTRPNAVPDSEGIPAFKCDNVVVLVQNDFDACKKILTEHARDLACVLMELQSGAGGSVVLEKEFVAAIRQLTQELGILLIVDETMSLRAATGGLQSLYQVTPDLTVMGKMIGGGLPIGAVGGSREVFRVVQEDKVMMSGTHHGHPLACAAGSACLRVMDDAACQRLNGMAERIKAELNAWAADAGHPFIVFGAFSMLGYAFTRQLGQRITTHRDYWYKLDAPRMNVYALDMAVRGYFPVHRGQISLSLPMTDADITGYIETSKEIIQTLYS